MKSLIIVSALTALLSACAAFSPAPPSSVAVSRLSCPQGAVHGDQELQRYAGCTSVAGDLAVEGITSLEPLAALRRVQGTFTLRRTELYTLAGLEQLRSVNALRLEHNPKLISIAGLNGLSQAASVTITRNPRVSKTYGLLKGLEPGSYEVSITKNFGLQAEGIRTVSRPRVARTARRQTQPGGEPVRLPAFSPDQAAASGAGRSIANAK